MSVKKEISQFKYLNFTKKVRILNILVYALVFFFANIYQHFTLTLLFFYLHLFVITLFLILELRYIVITKRNFSEHVFTNWLVFFGFLIIIFDVVKVFFRK